MGENVRTSHQIHVHGLTAEEFNQVCDRLGINSTTLQDDGSRYFKVASLLVPYTNLQVTYYTRDLT